MKVLVFEFMTGGGASDQHPFDESQIEFLRQGASMLEPIVEDFAAAGHEVTVLCDAKLKQNLNASLVFTVKRKKHFTACTVQRWLHM